jgi:ligand-binding sensor domain-containing protein
VSFTQKDGLGGNYVTDLHQDDDGTIWATTDGGVSVRRNGVWLTYGVADGLVSESVFDVAVDSRGRKWFSTMGGISRLDGFSAEHHPVGGAV